MNSAQFYDNENVACEAYQCINNQEWTRAELAIQELLLSGKITREKELALARINLASAQMAQGKSSSHWVAIDDLININDKKLLPADTLPQKDEVVIVRTDVVGIGDIAHFLPALKHLIESEAKIIVALRPYLIPTFGPECEKMGVICMDEEKELPEAKYHTHLVSFLGRYNLTPDQLAIQDGFAANISLDIESQVAAQANQFLQAGYDILLFYPGEHRQVTVTGGRKLPENPDDHGRELTPSALKELLRQNQNLIAIDMQPNKEGKPFDIGDENLQKRVVPVVKEQRAFDVHAEWSRLLNKCAERPQDCHNHQIYGIGADNGPTNVGVRFLNQYGRNNFALVVPNPNCSDMRNESPGGGNVYRQRLSHIRIVKAESPEKQSDAFITALAAMRAASAQAQTK